MSIEFDEDNLTRYSNYVPIENKTGSKMGDWLVKKGFVSNAAGANILLIIIAVLVFGLSFYFFAFGLNLPFQNTEEVIDPSLFPPGFEL